MFLRYSPSRRRRGEESGREEKFDACTKRFGGKRKATNAATEDFIGTVLSKNDIVVDAIVVRDNTVFSDLAYVENDAWWGWAFAPGGFVLGPSILFALYILGTLIFDAVAKQMKTKEEEDE